MIKWTGSTGVVTPEELALATTRHTGQRGDVKSCDLSIVAVQIALDSGNKPDLSPSICAFILTGKALKAGFIVFYKSTEYRGLTEKECIPVVEKYLGSNFGALRFSHHVG